MNPQFHLQLDPEIIDRCEEIRSIATKKWTNASSVSLAKLDQVKTKIYNIGLNDAKDLRPHTCGSHRSNSGNGVNIDELKTEPPLSTLSYQKTAWGSNTSIPELLKQHSIRSRPVSSNVPSRTRPWSGHKNRPSTTNPHTKPPTDPARAETAFTVKGAKFDPISSRKVLIPHSIDGWAAPSSDQNNDEVFLDVPRVPASSPDFSDEDDGAKRSPVLLRRPTPEPLHLQLPSVGEGEDDDDDDDDDLDTDRLLEKASVLSHKSNFSLYHNDSLESLPSISNNEENGSKVNQRSEVIEKVISAKDKLIDSEEVHRSDIKPNGLKSSSVLFREDKNLVFDISARQPAPNSRPPSASNKRIDYKNVSSRINSGVDKSRLNTRRSSLKQSASESSENSEPLPIFVSKITTNQLGTSPTTNQTAYNLKVAYDSSTSQVPRPTSPITIINLGYGEENLQADTNRGFSPSLKLQNQGQRPTTPVTIVTVDYGEDSSRKSTKKSKKDTVLSEILSGNEMLSTNIPIVKIDDAGQSRPTSAKIKNYYEQAIKPDANNDKVFKTTKTLEFAHDGPKDISTRSALEGQLIKPTEAVVVSAEKLKKSKQLRPPSIRRSAKGKSKPAPVVIEEPTTEELFKSLTTDIPLSVKKPITPKTRKEATNIDIPPLNSSQDKPPEARIKSAPARFPAKDKQALNKNSRTIQVRSESAKEKRPPAINNDDILHITSKNPVFEQIESADRRTCQNMTNKLAEHGINVAAETLERALYPPTGRTLYYDISGHLPSSYTSSLLSHPRVWMPEQYKRFKEAEKQLERANHMMWIQKRDEEREYRDQNPTLLRKPQTAKKRRKKVKKVKRSQSIC